MHRALAHSDVFRAIADPTRRAILNRLRSGDAPVNALAADFAQTRPAISKHLRILRRARLVREQRVGRERIYQLKPESLRQVADWIEGYRLFWQRSLTNLKRYLETEADQANRANQANQANRAWGGDHPEIPAGPHPRRNAGNGPT
jgi:DNA-binding transcriptional ArsR family regulator